MESTGIIRRKSYTATFKIKVCQRAEKIGNRKAGQEFGVSEVCVRRWKKIIPALAEMNKKRRRMGKRGGKWPDLERELRQWITNKRSLKAIVTSTQVRLQAKAIARTYRFEDFTASAGWYSRFMKRSGLSMRCRTSIGQPLPDDWINKLEIFRAFVAEKIAAGDVPHDNFFNMDEVPCQFDMPGSRTIAEKGEEDISIVTTGSEKTSFTIVLGVSAEGEKLDPMVIFKRKTIPKEKFPNGILVRANEKGWINAELMQDWLVNVWNKRKSVFFKKPRKENCLLVYDACTAHLTPDVKNVVQKHTQLAVIPGGLTKFLQPLDISVNKSFKGKIRNCWDEWMLDETMVSLTKSGNRRKATFSTVCEWIVKAWKEITVHTIRNGFTKAGIATYDSVNDDEQEHVSEVETSDVEDEEMLDNLDTIIEDDLEEDLLGDMFNGFEDLNLNE